MKILELLSESTSKHQIHLMLDFNSLSAVSGYIKNNKARIAKAITEKAGTKVTISVFNNAFTVALSIDDHQVDALDNYKENVIDIFKNWSDIDFEEIRENIEDHRVELSIYGSVPNLPIPISYPYIFINTYDKCSLSGIDKVIGTFEYLEFSNVEHVVSSVLGILKVSKKQPYSTINITTSNFEKLQWISILNKQFRSKDILTAQEELMDNGLKVYAKL